MKLRAYRFELPLRHVFTISRGSISVQTTLIVELEEDGLRGYGEATTNSYYGATIESMQASLTGVRSQVEQASWQRPEELWEILAQPLKDDPFTLCAVDQAAHDLWGKRHDQPVYALWGLSTHTAPVSNYTIGIDDIDVMIAKLREFPDWPVYKIKLGTPDDLQIVRRLRRETAAPFRVDANCGWTVEQTVDFSAELKPLDVQFIEQPLAADMWDAMAQVYRRTQLPLMADESCIDLPDVDRCAGHFHGVNIKLVKCGGLTPARRMIDRARQLGLRPMVGCMTESTVGISAIAQLLPLLDYVDMDGAVLLAEDIATGVRVERGVCHYTNRSGNGVELIRTGRPVVE